MPALTRKAFLKNLAALAAGSVLPRHSPAADAACAARAVIRDQGIVDLHCHPSLKMYLLGRRIWDKSHPGAGTNPFAMQITVDELKHGWMKGLLCAHHLPERAITREALLFRILYPLVRGIHHLGRKIENEDDSNFTQINIMMDELETQLHRANQEQCEVKFVVARSYAEFERAIRDGCIPVAHAIEGAHALGRNSPLDPVDCRKLPADFPEPGSMHDGAAYYLRNLDALKARGVCLMTLSHFFENDLSFPVEGISADAKRVIGLDFDPTDCNRRLTRIGERVVERMLDIGMIVDLTHAAPKVRAQVFQINDDREKAGKPVRPLTFTHTGSREVFEQHAAQCKGRPDARYGLYDVDCKEIDRICACRGVIGVIPENFWLVGCDAGLDPASADQYRDGIDYMVDTIRAINARTRTKQYDNIAIGTDFDGFADAPRDLHKPSQLGALVERLKKAGVRPDQICKITSGNALRLLRTGWT